MNSGTVWISPTEFITGDPALKISYPLISLPAVEIRATKLSEPKWIELGLTLPPHIEITAVRVCYQLTNKSSFISQIRLIEMQTPGRALIRHEDPKDLRSTDSTCYVSELHEPCKPKGAVTLALRLDFHRGTDKIILGSVGIDVTSPDSGECVPRIEALRALADPASHGCISVLGYYDPEDGGGGVFWFDNTMTESDDGGTIIKPDYTILSSGSPGCWRRLINTSTVSAKWFGVKGDNTTDNTDVLYNLRRYLRAHDGCTVMFPPGDYVYGRPFWLRGVKTVRLLLHGATFRNKSAGDIPFNVNSQPLVTNTGAFNKFGEVTDEEFTESRPCFGHLFETASAGTDTIVLKTLSDAANFSAGDRILLYGYGQQARSSPPNPRYFEYKTVSSVDLVAGSVTFAECLLYRYRSDWYDFANHKETNEHGTGAPRILNLDRTDYTFGETLIIEGGEFREEPTWSPDPARSNGMVAVTGYRRAILIGVKAKYFVPSVCERVDCHNCEFGEVETDKVIQHVLFEGCTIGKHTQGTGVNILEFRGGTTIRNGFDAKAKKIIIDGVEFHGPTSDETAPKVMIDIAGGKWPIHSVEIKNARFHVSEASWQGLVNGGGEDSFTVTAVSGNTKVLIAVSNDTEAESVIRPLDEDFIIRTDDGKTCHVTDIYRQDEEDAKYIAVEGEFSTVPQPGDIFKWPYVKKISLENIQQFGAYAPLRRLVSFPGAESIQVKDRDDRHFMLIFGDDQLPRSAADETMFVRGTLKSIYVNVQKPYSGTSLNAWLQIRNKDLLPDNSALLAKIDLKLTGSRQVTEFSALGAKGGDILSSLVENRMKEVAIQVQAGRGFYLDYSDATELPLFTLVLEFVRYR